EAGWRADCGACVAAQARRAQARGHRRRRAAARAAGDSAEVPRVVDCAVVRILAGDAEGELVQVLFSQDHRAGRLQMADHRGVELRHVVAQDGRAHGRRYTGEIEKILDPDRDTVQWAAPAAAANVVLGLPRSRPSSLRQHADVRVEGRVEALYPREIGPGKLNGR